jgi:hypothetical protein
VLEFLVGTLQEQIKSLGKLNIVISRLPIQRFQELQVELVQEINHRGDVMHQYLAKMRDESA